MAPYRDRASQGSASVDNNSDDSDSAGYRANVGTLLVNWHCIQWDVFEQEHT